MTARFRVKSPVTTYTGAVGELMFVKGVYEGEVSDAALQYFQTAGYTVEKLPDGEPADAEQTVADAGSVEAAQAEADAAAAAQAQAEADQAAADAAAANQTGASQ